MEDSFSTDEVPAIWQQQLANLVFNVKDWQVTHGMLLKFGVNVEHLSAIPVGVSLLPSSFPKRLFEEAQRLQPIYNRLYAAISEDEEWLYDILEGYVESQGYIAFASVNQSDTTTGSSKSTGLSRRLCGKYTKRSSLQAVSR